MKVTSEIGMYTRLSQALAKQRTDGKSSAASAPSSLISSASGYSSLIKDKIDISTAYKGTSDVQSLTSSMTGKKFSTIKEYGAYFLESLNKIKSGKT